MTAPGPGTPASAHEGGVAVTDPLPAVYRFRIECDAVPARLGYLWDDVRRKASGCYLERRDGGRHSKRLDAAERRYSGICLDRRASRLTESRLILAGTLTMPPRAWSGEPLKEPAASRAAQLVVAVAQWTLMAVYEVEYSVTAASIPLPGMKLTVQGLEHG